MRRIRAWIRGEGSKERVLLVGRVGRDTRQRERAQTLAGSNLRIFYGPLKP